MGSFSRSRARRILLGILFVPLAGAIGLELGSRALDRLRGEPWGAEERRAAIEETCRMLSQKPFIPGEHPGDQRVRSASDATILHPYTGWEQMLTQERIASELDYYRSPEAEDVYDICILGASAAQSFARIGERRFREHLQGDPHFTNREIRVHDDACAGYKQPQPAMSLTYLLAMGHEPDAVIEIDGFNEAALGWTNARNGASPAYPFLRTWAQATQGLHLDDETLEQLDSVLASQDRADDFGEWFLSTGWWRSSFLGHVGWLRLERLRADYVAALERYTDGLGQRPAEDLENRGPPFQAGDEALVRALAGCWEEGSIGMKGMCAVRGITYLHVLQPALPDRGTKPLTPKEIDSGGVDPSWIEGVERIYPKLREAGRRLEARGIAFFDATSVFKDHTEDIYVDACHVGEHGNEILADAIADALIHAEGK